MSRSLSSSSAEGNNAALLAVVLTSFVLVLPSCCLPKLQRPECGQPLPETFNGVTSAQSSAQIDWRDFFSDPALTSLIEQALAGNQELKIRNQEVRITNNEIMARIGEYLPFLNLGASAGIEKSSRFTREGAVEDQLEVAPGKGFPEPLPDFLVAADISWEVDIWRKLRNAKDAAVMRYFATAEGRNYYVTRLIAEVAENYYEILALDNRMRILDATIEIQTRSLEMAEAKKEAARGTELAVQRFQAEVRKNKSEKLIIQQEIIEAENRINLLAGRFPQAVDRQSVNYIDVTLPSLSVGVPSQLLQNRADIRQAERELAAAGLDVRVARARFYPSLTLHAGVGYQAFNTKYLFNSPESLIYNAAGDLVAPVINRRAIKADYLSANARQLQAVYNYQQVILTAFTEVINYLAKVDNYGQSIELKKQQLTSLEASVDAAISLFQNARVEYVEVLLAQRELMEARLVLINTKREQLVATVNAYQALGGGGQANDLQLAAGLPAPPPGDETAPLEQPLQLRPAEEIAPAMEAPEPLPADQFPQVPDTIPAAPENPSDEASGPPVLAPPT